MRLQFNTRKIKNNYLWLLALIANKLITGIIAGFLTALFFIGFLYLWAWCLIPY